MEKLGIQPFQLLMQSINFLILLFLLKKYLYQPVLKMLSDRRKKIEEGLSYSSKMKSELEKSEKKGQELVAKAREEARRIEAEARKELKKREGEILEKAQKEAETIIKQAEKELESMRQNLEKDMHKKAVDVAARIVEKLVADSLSDSDHARIIDKKLKEVAQKVK